MNIWCWEIWRTIGEIIEQDIGGDGIYLGLKEDQIPRCVSHSANSYKWGMEFLEKNVNDHPNYLIRVSMRQGVSRLVLNVYTNLWKQVILEFID